MCFFFFHIFSSPTPPPAVCQPASWTTAFTLRPIEPCSEAAAPAFRGSAQAETTLSLSLCVCNWVLLLAGNSVGDLQLKAILLVRPSVQSVSMATVALWSRCRTSKINHLLLAKIHPIPKKEKKNGYKIFIKKMKKAGWGWEHEREIINCAGWWRMIFYVK